MVNTAIATAADYADAMFVARRAKNIITLLLSLMLLGQVALFVLARTTEVIPNNGTPNAQLAQSTAPSVTDGVVSDVKEHAAAVTDAIKGTMNEPGRPQAFAAYAMAATLYLGMILAVLLPLVLFLLAHVMLVGRLIGVASVTSAFVLSLVLVVILFPWQAVLNNASTPGAADFVLPGVLFTWRELTTAGHFPGSAGWDVQSLKYVRFVGAPLIALILLLLVHVREQPGTEDGARRGVRRRRRRNGPRLTPGRSIATLGG